MRWRYLNEANPAEAAQRQERLREIDAFWQAFIEASPEIVRTFSRETEWDLPGWMEQTLQRIEPQLMWEFGPALTVEGHRLVITPESVRTLRPLVATILERAPRLTGWEFYAHRRPEELAMAIETVAARCGPPVPSFSCEATRGVHNLIDLCFHSREVEDGDEAAEYQAFVLAESLLGEEVLDKWIGEISVAKRHEGAIARLFRRKEEASTLADLPARVTELRRSIIAELPPSPWCSREPDEWSLLELEPEQADDYPWQSDIFLAKTPSVPLWQATRASFSDERFTRCSETFCYLKLDGSEGLDEEKFADKGEIEDAMDELLMPTRLGRQIGGGTGLRYSYIELALTDLEQALPAIVHRLRAGNVPRKSWLLFHDAELEDEWIGVYDDTPPPPR